MRWSELMEASRWLTRDEAARIIADDDDLFDLVASYTTNPDEFDDHPELTAKLKSILQRIKPEDRRGTKTDGQMSWNPSPLYRGEADWHAQRGRTGRGFHSWTSAPHHAYYFAKDNMRDGVISVLDRGIKGVSLIDIADWRMRLRPSENHYGGNQMEWLVLDPNPKFVRQDYDYHKYKPRY